jgi:hypothetical protein
MPQQFEGGYSSGTAYKIDLWVRSWDDLRWHYIHIKFHDDRSRHSGYCRVIISIILGAAVLVILTGGIYELRLWDGLSWHGAHEDWLLRPSNIKIITLTIWKATVLDYWWRDLRRVLSRGVIWYMIHKKVSCRWCRRSRNDTVLTQKFEML